MAYADTPDKQQSPAVSPKLKAYVDTAIACLQIWARANGQNWDALTDHDALLLQAFLTKSRSDIKRSTAPIFPRNEFKGLSGEGLTGRRWDKFLRWYGREIETQLTRVCTERVEPVLYPGRSSARGGGHPDKSQAIYFLSFDRPSQLAKPRALEGAASRTAAPVANQPEVDEPRSDAKGHGLSSTASAPLPNESVAGEDASPDAANTEPSLQRPRMPQSAPPPMGVFLGMPSADGGGSSMAWMIAMALAVVIATAGAPVGNPLADEFLRFLSAAQDALSGAIIVRF